MNVQDYNACVDMYSDGLYRFLLKNTKDEDIAKDLVQDSFEKLWRKIDGIDKSKAKSYLFTTGYHAFIDYTRKQKYVGDYNEIVEQSQAYSQPYNNLKEVINDALDKLPEIQRTVIMLRDYEGYDYKEIGEITNLSESQVKVYIFRGRQTLKNYLVKLENIL
ncbi:MAG: RNA polymerase sigma factor [Bacteroidia bacterium]